MKNVFTSLACALLVGWGVSSTAQAQVKQPVAIETGTDQAPPRPSPAPPAEEEQTNVVLFTGTVKHDKLKALPGATVYVRSTRQMAVADENGDFSLELDFSNGPVDLNVSYAGYEDQSVSIADPNLFLVVSMNPRAKKK